MKRIGDDRAGFSVEFDPGVGAVRVRAWGFWDAGVSDSFATTVAETCAASPRGASLLMDMSELRPLRDEGQKAFGRLVGRLPELGVERAAVETASHLVKLQLLRLVSEHGAKSAVEFVGANAEVSRHGPSDKTQKARTMR